MIICNRSDLTRIINEDCKVYRNQSGSKFFIKNIIGHPDAVFCRFIICMRKEQYYKTRSGLLNKLLYLYYMGKKSKYGMKLGIELHGECVGEGLRIRHYGCIIVNSFSKIGNNCTFRGDNCVGVARDGEKAPRIGNNVDIGVGAKIIGDIDIADNCIIGANAVVIHSCMQEGAVLAGVPAVVISKG